MPDAATWMVAYAAVAAAVMWTSWLDDPPRRTSETFALVAVAVVWPVAVAWWLWRRIR